MFKIILEKIVLSIFIAIISVNSQCNFSSDLYNEIAHKQTLICHNII